MKLGKMSVAIGSAASLYLSAGAQVYFSEDFEAGDTATHTTRGWVFDKNETALEGGTDFGVVTAPFDDGASFPSGSVPGSSNRDPETGAKIVHPPTVRGTASTGNFLLSDSDSGSGSDDVGSLSEFWAITPKFSTLGSTEAWFHGDITIENNNNGECIYEFSVSVDGGTTWIPFWATAEPQRPWQAWRRGAFSGNEVLDGAARMGGYPVLGSKSVTRTWDGIHGRVHFKLPAEANNKPDVRIKFALHEAGDAWYMAADNLLVDNNPPPIGSQTVLNEAFETGIPTTWKKTDLAGDGWGTEPLKDQDGNWRRKVADQPLHIDILREAEKRRTVDGAELPAEALLKFDTASFEAYPELTAINPNGATDGRWILMLAGGNYALRQEGSSVDEQAYLETPSLNLSNAKDVYLDFLSELLIYNGSANAEVFVSVDGGSSFTRIFTYRGALMDLGEGPYFTHHYIPVPEAVGKNNVIFRFASSGGDPDQYRGFWAIDDVRVTMNPVGVVAPPTVGISSSGANVILTFEGVLEQADGLNGPWQPVSGSSPLTIPATSATPKYYRSVR
jgi:hypothetical protein